MKMKLSPVPYEAGEIHRRVPADQVIPTQHLGAVRGQEQYRGETHRYAVHLLH